MPAPVPRKSDAQHLADFVARCPDCQYDLTGLEDGACPECGLGFQRRNLERMWIAKKRRKENQEIPKQAALVASGIMMGLVALVGLGASNLCVMGFLLGVWLFAVLSLRWAWEDKLRAEAFRWLIVLPPLLPVTLGISTSPDFLIGFGIIAVIVLVICRIALKGSPLVSFAVLAPTGPGLLLIVGLRMVVGGILLRRNGDYWSDYDWPASPRWRPMNVDHSIEVGMWAMLVGVGILIVMAFSVRRALVRLRKGNWG